MPDSIGKPCECIYEFEKHYFILGLDKLIEDSEQKLKRTKEDLAQATEEEKKSRMYESLQNAEAIYNSFISDVKTVKDRVSSMKTCS